MIIKFINFLIFYFITFITIISCKKDPFYNNKLQIEFQIQSFSQTTHSDPLEKINVHDIEVTLKCFDNNSKNKKIVFEYRQVIDNNNILWIPSDYNKGICQLEIEKFYIDNQELNIYNEEKSNKKIIIFNDKKSLESSRVYKSKHLSKQVTGKATYNKSTNKAFISLYFLERKHSNDLNNLNIEFNYFEFSTASENIIRIEIKNNNSKELKNNENKDVILTFTNPELQYDKSKMGISNGNPTLESDKHFFHNLPKCEHDNEKINNHNPNGIYYTKTLAPNHVCALVYKRKIPLEFIQKFELNNQKFSLKYQPSTGLTFED